METSRQIELLFQNGHQHVDADGDPDLGLDRIGRGAEETLDPQMLLDPLEKQFHLPPAFVQQGDGKSGQSEVVRQIDKETIGFGIEKTNPTQSFRIPLPAVEDSQCDDLVGAHTGGGVYGQRMQSVVTQRVFCSDNEEPTLLMQNIETGEIQVTAIHHVERTGFDGYFVQSIHVVKLAVADVNKGRNGPAKIQQRMQFDRRLGASETRPRKHAETKIDRRGIQRVDRRVQFGSQWFVGIQASSATDQLLRQGCVDTPVAVSVCIRQSTATNRAPKPQMVQQVRPGAQTIDRVSQAFSIGQLPEAHAQELIPAGERLHFVFAAVARYATSELLRVNRFHHLGKNRLSCIHASSIAEADISAKLSGSNPNRSHSFLDVTCSSSSY